jgi:hypothetical protein
MEFSAPHRSVIAVQQLPQKRNSLYEQKVDVANAATTCLCARCGLEVLRAQALRVRAISFGRAPVGEDLRHGGSIDLACVHYLRAKAWAVSRGRGTLGARRRTHHRFRRWIVAKCREMFANQNKTMLRPCYAIAIKRDRYYSRVKCNGQTVAKGASPPQRSSRRLVQSFSTAPHLQYCI